MLPEKALSPDAEVATLIGLHQQLGGPFKLVRVFRRWKFVGSSQVRKAGG